MQILKFDEPAFDRKLKALNRVARPDPMVSTAVREILDGVEERGDSALLEFSEKFGGPKLTAAKLRVKDAELDGALEALDPKVLRALKTSHRNVLDFAKQSMRKNWTARNAQGAQVGERFDGFSRVGIYVPGGTAPLVSTAIMTVTLAKAAGVGEIVVTSPCGADGKLNPALLAALKLAGATEVYRVGGAQAIAALAFGTKTIRPVVKIFGPGNAYVVEAKRQVFGRVAVDLLPGPSEVLVVADDSANAEWVAADLLAQAEHGSRSVVGFVTNSAEMLAQVEAAIHGRLQKLSRQTHLLPVIEKDTFLVLVESMDEAIRFANDFAAEHVSLVTKSARKDAERLTSTGAIFVGGWSPVAAGDFMAGPSHELPTGGAGKAFPGLTVDQFQRRTSVVEFDEESLRKSLPVIEVFSGIEGLDAHGESAAARFE